MISETAKLLRDEREMEKRPESECGARNGENHST
jgi:hypothetical protein